MSKRGFGLAGSINTHCRIFYENIFSQFQIGRVVDLLCTLAADSGANLGGVRGVVNAALIQACRYQGLFNSSMTSLEPVSVEYGSDPEKPSIAIQFTVTEDLKEEFLALANGAEPGEVGIIKKLGRGLIIKYHPESGRAEFQCTLPYQAAEDAASEAQPFEFVQIENSDEPAESDNEYVGLGDVEYTRLLKANPESPDGETESNAKKIITAATSTAAKAEAEISQEMDQKLDKGHSKEEITEAIASSASIEQTAEAIKRNLDTGEITELLAKGKADNLAEILTSKSPERDIDALLGELMTPNALRAALTEEEVLRLVKDRLSDDAKAKILSNAMSDEEMGRLLDGGLSDSEKANLLATSDLADAGKLLAKALEQEEVNRLIKDSLSDELKAKALSQELSQAEISELVSENLNVADKARILAHFDPEKTVTLIKDSVDDSELAKILAEQLTEEEQADLLMESLPPEVTAELLASKLTNAEKAKLLSKANPKFAAKVMKQMHTPEELAELIKEAIPEEEQGEILSEGLKQEEISEIITKSTTKQERAKLLVRANPNAVAQVIRESASELSIEELIQSELPKEEIAKALAHEMPEADLARMVRGSVPEEELSRIVAGGLPEEEIARIVKGSMPEEELSRLVRGSIPEEELARIVKGSSSEEEVKNIIRGSADPKQIAETILAGSTPQEAADLIKSCLTPEQISEAISSLPAADLAKAAFAALPPEELVRFAKDTLPPEEFSKKIAASLTPEQIMNLTIPALKNADVAKEILSHFSSQELASKIKDDIPSHVIASAAQDTMSEQQIIETLSSGLDKKEFAKILTSTLPRDSYATVLAQGLPAQEMARALSEGLTKEKFAQLVTAAVPKSIVSQNLVHAGYTGDLTVQQPQAAPTQAKLEPGQVAQLLNPDLSRNEAMSVLSTVLPMAAAEGMFAGAVPKADIKQALETYLPNPELASNVATSLARFKEDGSSNSLTPASDTRVGLNEASGSGNINLESSDKSAKDKADALHSQQKAQIEKTFQGKLDEQKRAVEFYVARSRKLEAQLKFTEDKERKAAQEAKKAKKDLENILAATPEPGATPDSAEQIPEMTAPDQLEESTQDKAKTSNIQETERKREREALRFFQKKAREFEGELRRAEGEIRRLNAEHTKELLKLTKAEKAKAEAKALEAAAAPAAAAKKEKAETEQSAKASGDTSTTREKNSSTDTDRISTKSSSPVEGRQSAAALATVEGVEGAAQGQDQPAASASSESEGTASPQSPEAQLRALEAQIKQRDTQIELAEAKLKKSDEEKTRLQRLLAESRANAGQRPPSAGPSQTQDPGQTPAYGTPQAPDAPAGSQEFETEVVPQAASDSDSGQGHNTVAQLQVYQNRVRSLESKIERLERALKSAGEAGSRAYEAGMAAEGNEFGKEIDRGGVAAQLGSSDSTSVKAQSENSSTESGDGTQTAAKKQAFQDTEDIEDLPQKMEEEVNAVDQDLTGIVKRMEKLKDNISDQPSKRAVDSLMSSIMQEKARLSRMTQELTTSIRKKEHGFKSQEAMLVEELKKTRALAEQKQSNIDRMRQQAQEMQLKFDREKAALAQSSGTDTQYRMKFENSQRQIEMLNKEIEKANRRFQANSNQGPSAAQQREAAEFKKMAETAGKALAAKKQEMDTLKQQIQDKDKRETEYKRAIMKLQNELNQAKTAAKKSA